MIIGIGMDICEVERIKSVIARHGDRFLNKTFVKTEQAACLTAAKAEERYAFGTGWQNGIGFLSIEVANDELGAPVLRFHGNANRLAQEKGVTRVHLTLTHTKDYAAAVVILEGRNKG